MTTLTNARPLRPARAPDLGSAVLRSARAVFSGLIAAIKGELELRRSSNELATWDDYLLHDIGLTRGDIERVVRFGRQ